jgi:hypothetical protein
MRGGTVRRRQDRSAPEAGVIAQLRRGPLEGGFVRAAGAFGICLGY